MDQPFYPFTILNEAHRFDFVSVGDKLIKKTIVYQQIDETSCYNLVLADRDDLDGLDVFVISNNGDIRKIFSTVFQSINLFLKYNPDATILFYGSTTERTEIYQWAIRRELEKLLQRFRVQGYDGHDFQEFCTNECYTAFAISLKNQ